MIRVSLLVLLGTVTTIAVGWGFATSHGDNPPIGYLIADVFSATGFAKVREQLTDSDFPMDSYVSVALEEQGNELSVISVETQRYASGESWVKLWEEIPRSHLVAARLLRTGMEQRIVIYGEFVKPRVRGLVFVGNYRLAQRAVGWPLKSLSYTPSRPMRGSINRRAREENVWHLPNVSSRLFPSTDRLILPYGISWPGFAINTIFYAAILWLLALAPFAARRLIRRKRGRCIKCGYDLRGDYSLGCPECGWRREDVP